MHGVALSVERMFLPFLFEIFLKSSKVSHREKNICRVDQNQKKSAFQKLLVVQKNVGYMSGMRFLSYARSCRVRKDFE